MDIAKIRLTTQNINQHNFDDPAQLVSWMGAMQAQDFEMAKWAVGLRLNKSNVLEVENALNKGEILRTHLLRPTWHFVSADDIYDFLAISAPRIKTAINSRQKQLGINAALVNKSKRILEQLLTAEEAVGRDMIVAEFKKAGIPLDDNRAAHLLLTAEIDGFICSGKIRNKKHTYALLEERVPKPKNIVLQDAVTKLARKYFKSHGPATLEDFIWWSGMTKKDARNALETIKPEMERVEANQATYWLYETDRPVHDVENIFHLLPAYDEFLISYRDRSASITLESSKKTISNNGIFRPVIVRNGQVTGIWKRQTKNKIVTFEPGFFVQPSEIDKAEIDRKITEYLEFVKLNH